VNEFGGYIFVISNPNPKKKQENPNPTERPVKNPNPKNVTKKSILKENLKTSGTQPENPF
jgi:hypothetical protein